MVWTIVTSTSTLIQCCVPYRPAVSHADPEGQYKLVTEVIENSDRVTELSEWSPIKVPKFIVTFSSDPDNFVCSTRTLYYLFLK